MWLSFLSKQIGNYGEAFIDCTLEKNYARNYSINACTLEQLFADGVIPSTLTTQDDLLSSAWHVYLPASSMATRCITSLMLPSSLTNLYFCPWKISSLFLYQRTFALGLEYLHERLISGVFSTVSTSSGSSRKRSCGYEKQKQQHVWWQTSWLLYCLYI